MFNSFRISNLRSISQTGNLPLGRITLLVGANNSGKSTALRALSLVQRGHDLKRSDIRIGADKAEVILTFNTLPFRDGSGQLIGDRFGAGPHELYINFRGNQVDLKTRDVVVQQAPNVEPSNIVHPIYTNRVPSTYQQPSSTVVARSIMNNDDNIVARIKRLAGSNVPEARRFRDLCREILNVEFEVFDTNDAANQRLGVAISLDQYIPVEAMGAGLLSTLNLLVSLSTAKSKMFLLEEPENDLHPRALKALLEAVVASASENYFVITTHSSVVLTRLGGVEDSVVMHVTSDGQLPPTSSFKEAKTASERLAILADLGYELPDFALNEGWMIFEESSAERLIRQYFAKWYAPGLLRLNFLAASGDSRILPIMQDYQEMLLFAHLQDVYRGRAWVVVDGGESGRKIIDQLREKFKTWSKTRFEQWSVADFELYYPSRFSDRVKEALETSDKIAKRAAKKQLLNEVLEWIAANEEVAKEEFLVSAAEVVEKLRRTEEELRMMPFLPAQREPSQEFVSSRQVETEQNPLSNVT